MAETLAEWIERTNAETEQMELEQVKRLLAEERAAHDKTKHNRDTILTEKRIVEGKHGKVLGTATELHISSADALDPQKYQAMKALAAKQGRSLRIVSEGSGNQEHSAVKFVQDDDRGVLYANRRLVQQLGIVRLREIAADKRMSLQFFGTADDLPSHLHRRHAEIATGPDRDQRMEVE